ncbi:MAG TPA: DUF2785 domain-containing protein [Ktedonobacteraceae bacterium]|jgi:hypothetical protein
MQNIMECATDKEFLRSIAGNNYKIPGALDSFDFARALFANFASSDGELRDELSYMIFANGIIAKQKLTPEQSEKLLSTALDNGHLFYRIGEFDTDSVFMRSFSNLVIAALLYSDAQKPTFSAEIVQWTKKALLEYAHSEKDWRGYVEEKGWAHTMAHLADALDECAQNRTMRAQDRKEILMLISDLAKSPQPLYHEEDVRLAMVAYHIILGKQVDEGFLKTWVDTCFVQRNADVVSWTQGTNAKNFLRSLYFLLHWDSVVPMLAERISTVLKQQDEVYLFAKANE